MLARDGRVWLRGALDDDALRGFEHLIQSASGRPGARLTGGQGACSPLTDLIEPLLPDARPVRVVAFDKNETANWGVPWHQDRVIAVAARDRQEGFSNWSEKQGAWHCEPPPNVLEGMLFLRVHLDPATCANGAMEIALGSHRLGAVKADQAREVAETLPCEACLAERGDVLVLHMLMLHRSPPAKQPAARRTIRVDYARGPLPGRLRWAVEI